MSDSPATPQDRRGPKGDVIIELLPRAYCSTEVPRTQINPPTNVSVASGAMASRQSDQAARLMIAHIGI